jgi:hypothetical protein
MTTSTGTVLPRTSEAPPAMEMLYGSLATQMLSVAAELGIADLVADGDAYVLGRSSSPPGPLGGLLPNVSPAAM